MKTSIALIGLFVLFLAWHDEWFLGPLQREEINSFLGRFDNNADSSPLTQLEKQRFRQFFESDDGQPFLMVNLMKVGHYRALQAWKCQVGSASSAVPAQAFWPSCTPRVRALLYRAPSLARQLSRLQFSKDSKPPPLCRV